MEGREGLQWRAPFAMLGDEDSPECFVCTETAPAPRRSACLCTDRYVHDACLAEMLKSSSHAACPVCAAPYANVCSGSQVVGVKWNSAGALVCGSLLAAVALLGCAGNTWHILCCSNRNLAAVDVGAVSAAAMLMTVVGLGLLGILARFIALRGLARLVQSVVLRQLTVHVLPTPARALPREVAMVEL